MTPRLCACGCGVDLDRAGMRADAKWASPACSTRWSRANPGKSRREAKSPNRTRTRRPSGLSIRISARKAITTVATELERLGVTNPHLRARTLLIPLASPSHHEALNDA